MHPSKWVQLSHAKNILHEMLIGPEFLQAKQHFQDAYAKVATLHSTTIQSRQDLDFTHTTSIFPQTPTQQDLPHVPECFTEPRSPRNTVTLTPAEVQEYNTTLKQIAEDYPGQENDTFVKCKIRDNILVQRTSSFPHP